MRHQDFVERVWIKIRMEKGVRRIHTATKLPVSRKQTYYLIRTIFEAIAETLENGQTVHIPGFGKFTVKRHADGSFVFNPKKKVRIPRRADRMKTVKFRPSRTLLNVTNGLKVAVEE